MPGIAIGMPPAVTAIVRYDGHPSAERGPAWTAGSNVVLSDLLTANTTGTDAMITVTVRRVVSGASTPLIENVRVPAGKAVPVLRAGFMAAGGIPLQQGDSLHVWAEGA